MFHYLAIARTLAVANTPLKENLEKTAIMRSFHTTSPPLLVALLLDVDCRHTDCGYGVLGYIVSVILVRRSEIIETEKMYDSSSNITFGIIRLILAMNIQQIRFIMTFIYKRLK